MPERPFAGGSRGGAGCLHELPRPAWTVGQALKKLCYTKAVPADSSIRKTGVENFGEVPTMDQLGTLKLKYQSVLNYIAVKGVRLANLHIEGGKLLIRGAAGTEDIKNDVWNQIKLVDANWASDLVCDISIDPSLAPPPKTYTVAKGDTLWKIAQDQMGNGNLYKKIVEANGIPNENLIHPGDVLVIPDANAS